MQTSPKKGQFNWLYLNNLIVNQPCWAIPSQPPPKNQKNCK